MLMETGVAPARPPTQLKGVRSRGPSHLQAAMRIMGRMQTNGQPHTWTNRAEQIYTSGDSLELKKAFSRKGVLLHFLKQDNTDEDMLVVSGRPSV